MTEYPVQCYDNNGEPYGRYVTLVNNENCHDYKERYGIDGFVCRDSDDCFCKYSEANTFPFPSGTIGKTYERDEVEVVKQRFYPDKNDWVDCNDHVFSSINKFSTYPYARQIFRLIPQPVEKEPDPIISSRQYIEEVYGTSTFARSIECKDAESLMDMMDDFLDWAVQKKQEASR